MIWVHFGFKEEVSRWAIDNVLIRALNIEANQSNQDHVLVLLFSSLLQISFLLLPLASFISSPQWFSWHPLAKILYKNCQKSPCQPFLWNYLSPSQAHHSLIINDPKLISSIKAGALECSWIFPTSKCNVYESNSQSLRRLWKERWR